MKFSLSFTYYCTSPSLPSRRSINRARVSQIGARANEVSHARKNWRELLLVRVFSLARVFLSCVFFLSCVSALSRVSSLSRVTSLSCVFSSRPCLILSRARLTRFLTERLLHWLYKPRLVPSCYSKPLSLRKQVNIDWVRV